MRRIVVRSAQALPIVLAMRLRCCVGVISEVSRTLLFEVLDYRDCGGAYMRLGGELV